MEMAHTVAGKLGELRIVSRAASSGTTNHRANMTILEGCPLTLKATIHNVMTYYVLIYNGAAVSIMSKHVYQTL
jgi:hypothetical protein